MLTCEVSLFVPKGWFTVVYSGQLWTKFFVGHCTVGRARNFGQQYMSFEKNQCSLSFIIINVIKLILTELQNKLSQLFYILVIDFQSLMK
jgi:hypothetical protein